MSRRNNRDSGMTSDDAQSVQRFEVPFTRLTPHQLRDQKESLLNLVCTALIQQPRMSVTDPMIIKITKQAKKIAYYDPEFILKLAMYVRLDLNIRSTANYLLAVASNIKECQPYVRKYFGATIRLPSDWLDVAATYLILPDKILKGKALPTCLRKSMDEKFADFDAYQLGKYNKERTIKRKLKKIKEEQAKGNAKAAKPDKPMITLKQMIRQLHISSPNYQVMCLLGKKYPLTEQEFRLSGLPGNYDPDKSGLRMKLPTPETWETLLSEKGNKASTWEELIEHKKLPFMAMLRNLRNLIYTGVHPRYHRWVQNKLSNKQTIAQSKQFPTAFFSAYEVIPRDMEHFKQLLAGQNDDKKPKKDANGKEQVRRKRKKPIVPAHMPTNQIFDDYRRALDQSVKHATTCNVNPIRGSTVVFCNVSSETRESSPGAKGMGTSVRSIQEVGYLLGLMCKYVCEDCDFRVWSSPTGEVLTSHLPVSLLEGSILDNMSVVAEVAAKLGDKPGEFPFDYLEEMIRDKRKVDNFLVLSHHVINPSGGGGSNTRLSNLLNKYRHEVNPDLLFVSVDLSGSGKSAIGQDEKHPNDIQITGFSDQILRFIAERGDTNQLQYVEHIDEAKRLNKQKNQAALDVSPWWKWLDTLQEEVVHYPNVTTGPAWREARVFISSTFLDMHGERDVLTRIVLPEVKERAKQRRVRLYEVDLRWGVTEEEAQSGKSIQLCLDEVDRCRPFFIGILGERYGWAPSEYEVPDHPRFAWLKDYPKGRSITELEMHYAALSNPSAARGAFFYLRDHSAFINQVPEAHRKFFEPSSAEDRQKMADLKQRIRNSGLTLLDYYQAKYGGTEAGDGVVSVTELKEFSNSVFNDLWGAVQDQFPPDLPPADPIEFERTYHQAFVQQQLENFIGRKEVLSDMKKFVEGYHSQLLVISGQAGDGKSSLLANFAADYATKNPTTFVLPHFVGASPNSTDIRSCLYRLCYELKQVFRLDEQIPEDFKDLCSTFHSMLESASFKGKLLLVIDAVNQFDEKIERSHYLEWLPAKLPCKVIVSVLQGTKAADSLKHPRYRSVINEIPLPALEIKERTELIRTTLWKYHKKLDEKPMNNQMRILVRKADAGNPLFLTVACEELRVFGVYERVADRIKRMSDKLPRLFEEVLRRLEGDHDEKMVQDACSLIVTSRGGLVEKELISLLDIPSKDPSKWTALLRSLTPFLKPAGDNGEITFFHDAFKAAVQKRYISNPRTKVKYDAMLADYFYLVIDPLKNGEWKGCNETRAISELPHHLVEAEKWTDLHTVLCDLHFIEVKSMQGMVNGLISDYNEATKSGLKYNGLNEVKEFREFVKSCSHVISKNPTLTFQQAANQPSHTSPSKRAFQLWSERAANQSWIEWTNKPEESDPCKMTYSGFTEGVTATAFSSRDGLVACATRDCTIHIYDSESGSEICNLIGHSSWIPSIKFSPDGSLLASAGWDSIIILWDVRDAKEICRFTSHQRRVNDVAFSSDSSMLASASWDTDVKIYLTNGETREKYSVNCGERPLNSVAWGPEDKKLIVGTWDGTIKVISMDYEEEGKILTTMTGHQKSIQSVAYSPSGKHLVSGSLDQQLLLWDAQAGKLISSLSKHSKPVTSVAYTSDGSHLLSASADATIKVWDANLGTEKDQWKCESGWTNCCSFNPLDDTVLATGSSECYAIVWDITNHIVKHKLEHHARPITCIEFSPDGRYLATGSEDGGLAIWDPETGLIHCELDGHAANVTGMSWSRDSTRLVTCSDDHLITVWDPETGNRVRDIKGHESAVRAVCFDPKGKMLVSASRDNTLRIWDSRNGNQVSTLRGHTDWITSCAFNSTGNRIVSCAWDNTVRLWNPRRTEPIATMEGHDSSVAFVRFTQDDKNIISCSFDNTLKIWDSESATEITTLSGHKARVNGFSQNSEGLIASTSDDTTIRVWDPLAATEVRTLVGHSGAIRSASFHPQTKSIVTASDDKTMKYWDLGFAQENDDGWSGGGSSWGGNQSDAEPEHKPLTGHSASVNHLALSKSGQWLLSVGDDKKCFLWDTETSHVTRTFRLPNHPTFKCCAFSPQEQTFVTATDDGSVWLWDSRSAKNVKLVAEHNGPATSCSLSKDGGTVVSGGWDNNICISDLRTSNSRPLSGHTDWVLATACAPSGDVCVSSGWDETVRVWTTSSFSRKYVLAGHMDTVTSLAISPDSRYLASASYDSTVKIWNLTGGVVEATLPGHVGHVNKVAFSPTSPTVLYSAGSDGVVKLWDVARKSLKNEFMCKGPATACDVAMKNNELFMVFGDSIGNIYTAKLHGARV